ncbi:MAG TPA: carboxymuconolactone decarboxylase family protein, partial [Acidimicrobiales bacterium]
MDALQTLGAVIGAGGVPESTILLVLMRASQINGCAVCLDGHTRSARKEGESDERLGTLAAWRETPYFSDAERAALDLTEAVTRLADRPNPV